MSFRPMSLLTSDPQPWIIFVEIVGIGSIVWAVHLQFVVHPKLRTEQEKARNDAVQIHLKFQSQVGRNDELQKLTTQLREDLVVERGRLSRLRDIGHRGKMGEDRMHLLLEHLKNEGLILNYETKPALKNGKRPDAILTLSNGRTMVVDSKSPDVQDLDFDDNEKVAKYNSSLKGMVHDLSQKAYHYEVEGSYDCTWMLLPDEAYMMILIQQQQNDFADGSGVFLAAKAKHVRVVGPEGLRSELQGLRMSGDEEILIQKQNETKVEVQDTLVPKWKALQQHMGKVRNTTNRQIKEFNVTFEKINEMDIILRDLLDQTKSRTIKALPLYMKAEEESNESA